MLAMFPNCFPVCFFLCSSKKNEIILTIIFVYLRQSFLIYGLLKIPCIQLVLFKISTKTQSYHSYHIYDLHTLNHF